MKKLGETTSLVGLGMLLSWWTDTPSTQVRFPDAARDFLLESTFSADSLKVSVYPRVQSQALTSVPTLKIL